MDLKRKFDHLNLNNFLSDNITLGTADYYQNKYPNLPHEECFMLEALSRDEFDDLDIKKRIKIINRQREEYNRQIDQEFEDAKNFKDDDEVLEIGVKKVEITVKDNNNKDKFIL